MPLALHAYDITVLIAIPVRAFFENIHDIVATIKTATIKNKDHKNDFREAGLPSSPIPVITRWATWLRRALYYSENLPAVRTIISNWADEGLLITRAKEAINVDGLVPDLVRIYQQRWSRGHKARGQGQGQGHKKNPRPRPRPRTALPRTEPLEAKDRNARGQGQGPRTQAQVFSKKKSLQKFFSGDLQFVGVPRIYWDKPKPQIEWNDVIKNFPEQVFVGQTYRRIEDLISLPVST